MPDYTQADQPIRVDTALAEDVLLLAGFHGREEISQPFVFDLELLSEDPNLDPADLLRTPISIGVLLPDGEMRRIHGQVRSFGYEGRRGELSFYRAEMVPWLWFLSLSKDCRIFQNMSVPDILEEVFAEEEGAQFKTQFAQDYAEREYCVQYRESNLNFVSRLMEEEGIFYFFEHAEDGHTLVLTDYPQMKPCDGQDEVRMYSGPVPQEDVVRSLTQKQSVYTGTVTLADYDQLKPSLDLKSSMAGEEPDEIYEYQKNLFTELDDGERYARIALEREEAKHHVVRGQSTCRGFQAGRRFELTNHDRREANQEYAILEVSHTARTGSYVAGGNPGELDYENRFVAIPHGTSYRPPLRAPKPSMPGDQTAQVVGPAGEKINVDEHGRVKIQFHWDRLGGNDDNSSCWVRVSQNWAGKNWGGMFIPHVDQEVIVSFLEGDPDRPIITGRVYNAEHMPPQDLPANKHKSIIEDDYGNELVFDATPGDEHIRIHSPSHASTLELGKSIRFASESDWSALVKGKSGSIHEGPEFDGNIGFMGKIDLGGSLSVFGGFKVDVEVSEKVQFALGPSVKFSKGKEYSVGTSDYSKHVAKEIFLNSDKEVLVTGGAKDEALMAANEEALKLQFGSNSAAEKAKVFSRQHALVCASTAGGIASAFLASQDWQGDGQADDMSFAILGVGGLLSLLIPGAIEMKAAGEELWDKLEALAKQVSSRHDTVHSMIELNEKQIELESGSSKMKIVKDAEIEAEAGKGKLQIAKNGAVKVDTASGQVFKVTAGDVSMKATGQVHIKGNNVNIG